MFQRILLGPQRPVTNLGSVMAEAHVPDGPIAVISAAWQEAEGDIDDVYELVQRPLVDLNLYHRAEQVFAADQKLSAAYRARQEQLKELQRLYRSRLRQLMIAAREMQLAEADSDLTMVEQRHAITQLRALDRHHLDRVESIHAKFDGDISTASSTPLAEHTAAVADALAGCETVIITGGNVVVLMNRLRMFGVHRLLSGRNIVAWSAGAMVLSDLIVLYHDHMPQGRRDAEVLGAGAGVLPGYVFLPDAGRRLKDRDPVRVRLFSRRFAPAVSATLDNGTVLQFEGTEVRSVENSRRLARGGGLVMIRSA